MNKYQATIGLEIHAELATKTKMFCGCRNDPFHAAEPNIYVCPICMGLPGTLPVMNEQAVESAIMVGLALGCKIGHPLLGHSEAKPKNLKGSFADAQDDGRGAQDDEVAAQDDILYSKWDRKNYFYPDLPKGYQISQYDLPLCYEGYLEISNLKFQITNKSQISNSKRIRITRIHLEEDTGKLVHPQGADYSLIDFNRAGVPLLELVTEPVIESAGEAVGFAKAYQQLLRSLGAAEAEMEKGGMRVEVNISIRKKSNDKIQITNQIQNSNDQNIKLGTKVEVKNLNSFKAVEKAIEYEIERQAEILESGEKVTQETRGWDEGKQRTYTMRVKETAADYRYFPEPDLPPIIIGRNTKNDRRPEDSGPEETQNTKSPPRRDSATAGQIKNSNIQINIDEIKQRLPELPEAKREKYLNALGLSSTDAERLLASRAKHDYFDKVVDVIDRLGSGGRETIIRLAANWIINDLADANVSVNHLVELAQMLASDKVTSPIARQILVKMNSTNERPSVILEKEGIVAHRDEESLRAITLSVAKENPQAASDYQNGKKEALGFLVGQAMTKTKGQSDPALLRRLFEEILEQKL